MGRRSHQGSMGSVWGWRQKSLHSWRSSRAFSEWILWRNQLWKPLRENGECSRYVTDNRNVCNQIFDHLQHGEGLGEFNMIDINCWQIFRYTIFNAIGWHCPTMSLWSWVVTPLPTYNVILFVYLYFAGTNLCETGPNSRFRNFLQPVNLEPASYT